MNSNLNNYLSRLNKEELLKLRKLIEKKYSNLNTGNIERKNNEKEIQSTSAVLQLLHNQLSRDVNNRTLTFEKLAMYKKESNVTIKHLQKLVKVRNMKK